MIDEKKLIEKIRNAINDDRYDGYKPSAVLFEIFDMILEAPKVDKWIPCSERLPNPYESVLVTAKMKGDSHPLTYQGARIGCTFELSGVRYSKDYIVTAWQLEPEPWEGDLK